MKIGIDIRNIGKKRTGDEVVFFNLAKNLAQIDSQNEYLLFTDETNKSTLRIIEKDLGIEKNSNFKIVSLKCGNRFNWNFWTLQKYLRQSPVDIYHTQYITPWFVPKKIKIVTIVHDISFNFFPQFIKFSDLMFLKAFIPVSLKRADRIIGVSNFTKDEIVKYYNVNPEKVDWIHNAIGDNFLNTKFSKKELEAVRKKYNLPEKYILYIGTMQPRKNLPFLIEAFAGIRDKIPEIKLVLAGNRNARNFDKRINEAIKKLKLEKEVFFPGFIDENDKPIIFYGAHVFVFPSLYEGFGIPVIEAMSQGIPVLASDIPSLREIAGSGALFFDSSSLDDCREKLYTISIDEKTRRDFINLGYTRIQFFSWRKTAEKMLNIYKSLI